jgi:hypothetical protein
MLEAQRLKFNQIFAGGKVVGTRQENFRSATLWAIRF